MQNALLNKPSAVLSDIQAGLYQDALNKLEQDIKPKMDGCATSGAPDRNDRIRDCGAQGIVSPYLLDTIARVRALLF